MSNYRINPTISHKGWLKMQSCKLLKLWISITWSFKTWKKAPMPKSLKFSIKYLNKLKLILQDYNRRWYMFLLEPALIKQVDRSSMTSNKLMTRGFKTDNLETSWKSMRHGAGHPGKAYCQYIYILKVLSLL